MKILLSIFVAILILFVSVIIFSWVLSDFPSLSKERIINRTENYLKQNKENIYLLINEVGDIKKEYPEKRILLSASIKQFNLIFYKEEYIREKYRFVLSKPKTPLPQSLRNDMLNLNIDNIQANNDNTFLFRLYLSPSYFSDIYLYYHQSEKSIAEIDVPVNLDLRKRQDWIHEFDENWIIISRRR